MPNEPRDIRLTISTTLSNKEGIRRLAFDARMTASSYVSGLMEKAIQNAEQEKADA